MDYDTIAHQLSQIDKNSGSLLTSLNLTNQKELRTNFLDTREFSVSPDYKTDGEYNPDTLERRLKEIQDVQIETQSSVMGELLGRKKEDLEVKVQMMLSRGNSGRVRELSQQLYGVPDTDLVQYAEKLVRDNVGADDGWGKERITPDKVGRELIRNIESYGIEKWRYELTDSAQVSVVANSRLIKVPKGRMFGPKETKKLKLHEVGGHVLRAENGKNQPLDMFAQGFPGYLETEEGIAMFLQKQHDLMPPSSYLKMGVNTLVSDSAGKGETFKQTYDRLKDLGIKDDTFAFDRVMRGFRGGDGTHGAFTNGHLYLQGLNKVDTFVERGGKLKDLYVGKIGIDDLEMVEQIRASGVEIQPPQYLPRV